MNEDNRPVSYQRTLGTKTEKIRKASKKQNQTSDLDEKKSQKGENPFPE